MKLEINLENIADTLESLRYGQNLSAIVRAEMCNEKNPHRAYLLRILKQALEESKHK